MSHKLSLFIISFSFFFKLRSNGLNSDADFTFAIALLHNNTSKYKCCLLPVKLYNKSTSSNFASIVLSGEYGQLGQQTLISTDEPQRVEFFREQHLHVVDVVCGAWNTFAGVAKEEVV